VEAVVAVENVEAMELVELEVEVDGGIESRCNQVMEQ
jgi:hypothetical protein